MPLNFQQVRQHLDQFEFGPLFIQELGWSHPREELAARRSRGHVRGADRGPARRRPREAGITPEDAAHDPADRARIRAEIDTIVAHLYGLTAEEFEHMLDAFPLVDAGTKAQVLDTFRNWKPPSDDPLVKLIAAGESLRVEFKSTARWNIKTSNADKAMEHEVLKTVAAFQNSEGGTLLIGVTDKGTIHGLADDYKLLGKKPNPDGLSPLRRGHLAGAAGASTSRSVWRSSSTRWCCCSSSSR